MAAVATAELEIARRGLVATVTGLFYQELAADRRIAVARRAAGEATGFTNLTQQRESAREAAHADVVKAQLQQQQRDRDLAEALLGAAKVSPGSGCAPLCRPSDGLHPHARPGCAAAGTG